MFVYEYLFCSCYFALLFEKTDKLFDAVPFYLYRRGAVFFQGEAQSKFCQLNSLGEKQSDRERPIRQSPLADWMFDVRRSSFSVNLPQSIRRKNKLALMGISGQVVSRGIRIKTV